MTALLTCLQTSNSRVSICRQFSTKFSRRNLFTRSVFHDVPCMLFLDSNWIFFYFFILQNPSTGITLSIWSLAWLPREIITAKKLQEKRVQSTTLIYLNVAHQLLKAVLRILNVHSLSARLCCQQKKLVVRILGDFVTNFLPVLCDPSEPFC